ncbi:hypothetical protein MKX01_012151, partial [Papaver californicum]
VLIQMGNVIGKTIKVDITTESLTVRRYARICIEVHLRKPLLPSFCIGRSFQQIEYEGIDSSCFTCGRLNHKADNCSLKSKNQHVEENISQRKKDIISTHEGDSGPWMIVDRKSRRQPIALARIILKQDGSHFLLLQTFEEVEILPDSSAKQISTRLMGPPITKPMGHNNSVKTT